MKRSKITQIKYIPTAILKSILASAPYYVTEQGTEYHDQVDEIRDILVTRETIKMDRSMYECEHLEAIQGKYEARKKGLKWCPKCKHAKSHEEYYNRSDNTLIKRSICKACMRLQDIPF